MVPFLLLLLFPFPDAIRRFAVFYSMAAIWPVVVQCACVLYVCVCVETIFSGSRLAAMKFSWPIPCIVCFTGQWNSMSGRIVQISLGISSGESERKT